MPTAPETIADLMSDTTITEMPGFTPGIWDIDPFRSEVAFELSHLTVKRARGRFTKFTGVIVFDETPDRSSVNVTIDAATVTTGNPKSDRHVRSERFLDVEHFPTITFRSRGAQNDGPRFLVEGDLTIRGTSRTIWLQIDRTGLTSGFDGRTRFQFETHTVVSRNRFGVRPHGILELMDNALVIGDSVHITLKIEAVLREDFQGRLEQNGSTGKSHAFRRVLQERG